MYGSCGPSAFLRQSILIVFNWLTLLSPGLGPYIDINLLVTYSPLHLFLYSPLLSSCNTLPTSPCPYSFPFSLTFFSSSILRVSPPSTLFLLIHPTCFFPLHPLCFSPSILLISPLHLLFGLCRSPAFSGVIEVCTIMNTYNNSLIF